MNFIRFHAESAWMSWGNYAPLNERGTELFPTRSAVGGMICAALGLPRGNHWIDLIHASIRVHSRYLRKGRLVRDYQNHTNYQAKRQPEHPPERKVALNDKTGKTIQTWRSYIEDAAYEIVIEVLDESTLTAEQIAAALASPRFPIYFGRKSDNPSFPLRPEVIVADSVYEVFRMPAKDEFPVWVDGRYKDGLPMSIDSDSQPSKTGNPFGDKVVMIPHNVRDVCVAHEGRVFHSRTAWTLAPAQE